MESLQIDLLNPKAKKLLTDLADLNLIKIRDKEIKSEFLELLEKMRQKSEREPSLQEITAEVEAVRNTRYEQH